MTPILVAQIARDFSKCDEKSASFEYIGRVSWALAEASVLVDDSAGVPGSLRLPRYQGRVKPGNSIHITFACQKIEFKKHGGTTVVGHVVHIGPGDAADRLRGLG